MLDTCFSHADTSDGRPCLSTVMPRQNSIASMARRATAAAALAAADGGGADSPALAACVAEIKTLLHPKQVQTKRCERCPVAKANVERIIIQ